MRKGFFSVVSVVAVLIFFLFAAGCGQQLKQENEQLKAQVDSMTAESNSLKGQVEQLTKEKEELSTKVASLTSENESLKKQLGAKKAPAKAPAKKK